MEQKFWVMSHLPVSSFLTERFIFLYWVPICESYYQAMKLFIFTMSWWMTDQSQSDWKSKTRLWIPLIFHCPDPPPIPFYIEKIKYSFPQIPILFSTATKEDLYTYLPNTKTTVIIKTISNMTAKQAINTKIHGNSKWKNKHAS